MTQLDRVLGAPSKNSSSMVGRQVVHRSPRVRLYPTLRKRLTEYNSRRHVSTLSYLTELAIPSPEPAVPASGHPLAALRTVPLASDDQLEALEMYHNALVGHGGADRTVAKLISLDHNWPYMRQQVKTFIRQRACCQKMDSVRVPIHVHHYVTSTYPPFEVLNIDRAPSEVVWAGRRFRTKFVVGVVWHCPASGAPIPVLCRSVTLCGRDTTSVSRSSHHLDSSVR